MKIIQIEIERILHYLWGYALKFGNKNKSWFILYFSQFALPLQRNDRVYPTVTPAAMAEEHVCLCTDFLQQQPVEARILLAHIGGVCHILSGF